MPTSWMADKIRSRRVADAPGVMCRSEIIVLPAGTDSADGKHELEKNAVIVMAEFHLTIAGPFYLRQELGTVSHGGVEHGY